ncbi:helix-turn-helix domain-containing protein [Xanthovirga aplysinae]|uniref:helix-turn-helix domain-containing protein n=1 Tax=Xanthovirga aplysinae TaxID=2529853 RepID=UPI0012BD1788|nr:helix-turn-helix domain-containing protein [Xanthovirga aplysinae]MTI32770.1 AraC family transcriptional regulator [Xanthovirga aplysinae]
MNLEQQFIFLFSALGAINGFLLSGYFIFVNGEKRLSKYFLGGLLLMLSIRIIKSVFIYFNSNIFEFFIKFGLSACLLIGPFLYLYVTSMTKKDHKLKKVWWWHVVPFIIIISVFSFNYSYYEDRNYWVQFINLIYKQWMIYILISGNFLKGIFKKLIKPKQKLSDQEFWLLNIYMGTTIIWIAYETTSYTSYIVGALSFSLIVYISILLWVYKRSKKNIVIESPIKYANSSLSISEAEGYMEKLTKLMEEEKLFLNPSLTLTKLSKQLGINSKELSQVINQTTNFNYSKYIVNLRVQEAKRLLSLPEHQHYTIASIAYDSGFNSLSSFNASFKKVVGMTANDYRKQF